MRFLVHRRQSVEGLLDAALFEDPLERRAYEALLAEPDLHRLLASERADPELADLLRRLAVEEPVIPDEALGDPARAVVAQLVRSAAWRELRALERRARTEPDRWTEVNAALTELRLRLQELDREESGNAAVGGLVAWLAAGDRQADHG